MRAERGFSLLEMLVALAIFGLAVVALLNLAGENTRTAVIVEERVLAEVVADNRAVEAALLPAQQLSAASTAGREDIGGRDWEWSRRVSATADGAIVRVDVGVTARGSEQVVAQATVFRRSR